MATRNTPWPAGTPCWADNHVPDLEAARAFYGAVLGWQIDDPDPEAGNFAGARIDGRPVAGFLVAVDGAQPGWHVFFATEDIDATAASIDEHGGTSLFGPHNVGPDRGRFQLAADNAGAVFGVWQAGSLTGTGVYGEHGSLGWEDLRSSDPAASQAFYRAVFGHVTEPLAEAGPDYVLFRLPDGSVAPLGGMGGMFGSSGDSHWLQYFAVDDVDAASASATSNGGSITQAAQDTPYGRIAGLADPFGATFSIVTPAGPTPER